MEQHREQEISNCKKNYSLVMKILYFVHLVVAAIWLTVLFIIGLGEKMTVGTTILLCFYCYMGIWVLVVNFIFLMLDWKRLTVIFDRVIVKAFIIFYPVPLGFLIVLNDSKFRMEIWALLGYLLFISLFLLVFEIITCTCLEHRHPSFIYAHNDFKNEAEIIKRNRNEYHVNKKAGNF